MSMVTHARLLSRDMFQKRVEKGDDIYMHEMVYPLLQGYDSVALQSDATIIGSDQLFNEMMGRFYQERLGQQPQVIVTTKITPGIDGKTKQSKSIGNYIGLSHAPREKFGRVMSIPDALIAEYFLVYTDVPQEQVDDVRQRIASNPMECKLELAQAIVRRYHGDGVAKSERGYFVEVFSKRRVPDDAPVVHINTAAGTTAMGVVLACVGTEISKTQIRRLFEQGAISADGKKVQLTDAIDVPCSIQVGKRKWFKIEQA
jgi:tyrosyl-tRNA synthetase